MKILYDLKKKKRARIYQNKPIEKSFWIHYCSYAQYPNIMLIHKPHSTVAH
ncbi:hypothetical protein HanLR1_Chr16g0620611 [Helianthus annuus]|nr:hypothetical protein HanLR1_Chr16g0620611 [Helianthus annuus]